MIRTTHDDPALIADAIAPDNTDEMETAADDERRKGAPEPVGASVLRRPRWDEMGSVKQVRAIGCGMALRLLRSLGHRGGLGESSRMARVSVILGLSSNVLSANPRSSCGTAMRRDWHAMLRQ